MKKLVTFCLILLFTNVANADNPNCAALRVMEQSLMERTNKLTKDYQDEISLFGFSTLMVKDGDVANTASRVVNTENLIRGCSILVDKKTCNHVSKEIINTISSGLVLCTADHKYQCGICLKN